MANTFMNSAKLYLTSESVTEGHPDKMCDQISDAVLDAIFEQDPNARVACETATTTGLVMVMGEITTSAYVNIDQIVRDTVRQIGYTSSDYGFDANSCGVAVSIKEQSADIALGVDKALEDKQGQMSDEQIESIGAGDQGMMIGFACNETPELMPLSISLAHRITRRLSEARKTGELSYLRPDGKSQVTVEYAYGKPVRVDAIVVSTQHAPEVEHAPEAQATSQVLAYVLEHSLRLLHPFMPYVTETIWQNLPGLMVDGRALIISRLPQDTGLIDADVDDHFGRLQEIVRAIRNVRSEYNVEPGRRIPTSISAGEFTALIQEQLPLLASLARLAGEQVAVATDLPAPDKAVTLATSGVTVYVPLAGLVDLDAERIRIQKEIDNLSKQIDRSETLLANQGFVAKAPPEVLERERNKVEELRGRRQQLSERLAGL